MQVDAFGKIEPNNSVSIPEVKTDNDISNLVYENNYGRKRYGQRNYYQGQQNQTKFNENQSYQTYSVNDTQSVNTFLSSQI